MSDEIIRILTGAGLGLIFGILMACIWDSILKLNNKRIDGLEERVEFCEKWVKDLSAQYGEFLEGVRQMFQEAKELYAKEKAEKEQQDQVCECNLDNKKEET